MRSVKNHVISFPILVGLVCSSFWCASALAQTTNTFPSSGNVGVGTLTPSARVDISGVGGTDNVIIFRDSGNSNYGTFAMKVGQFDGGTTTFQTVNTTNFFLQAGMGTGLFMNTSGNFGIGTTAPAANLDINASGAWSSGWANNFRLTASSYPALRFFASGVGKTSMIGNNSDGGLWFGVNGTGDTFGSYAMTIQPGGNVGIGTPDPGTKLQVNGDIFANGGEARLARTQNETATRLLSYSNAHSLWMLQPNTQRFVLADGLDWDRSLNFEYTAGTTGAQAGVLNIGQLYKNSTNFTHGTTSFYTNGAERLRINSQGSVGIGTSSPHRTLDLSTSGQLTFGDDGYSSAGSPGMFWYSDNTSYGIYKSAGSWSGPDYQQLVLNFNTGIVINGGSAYGKSGTVLQPNGGNVGIGIATPTQKLSVAGWVQSTAGGFMFPDGSTQITAASGSGSAIPANIPAGAFGANTSGGTYTFPSIVNVNGGSSSNWGTLNIGGDNSINANGNIYSYSRICAGNNWGSCSSPTGGVVLAGSGTNTYGNVYLTGSGKSYFNGGYVGIGTTDPQAALDVAGDIKASGVIHAKYQDVAEWVPSSEQLAAGTVVVLDSTKSNQVTSSSVSYDTRVAEVISAQPGITLGEQSDSKVLVATTGRVKVKVDASKGPIHIGDLLVTSDVPGVAMKSEAVNLGGVQFHRPGTLIGKALEPLEKGKGEILVLLSLQ